MVPINKDRSQRGTPKGKERTMEARLNALQASPAVYAAMSSLEMFVRKTSKREPSLVELVKVRASQINGCAYCIDIHTKDARSEGETEQRLYALTSWRETPFFTARESAALAWTEALTLVTEGRMPDDIYKLAKQSFSDEELVNLTLAVITINRGNRLAISFRSVPGAYQPGKHGAETSK
jgi:AhpD family alkylhydroperoxidase